MITYVESWGERLSFSIIGARYKIPEKNGNFERVTKTIDTMYLEDQDLEKEEKVGIFKAISRSVRSSFADQWLDVIVPDTFDEYSAVVPGVLKNDRNTYGANKSIDVISDGSKVHVPENTAAFVFTDLGIVDIVYEPGSYEYLYGEDSVFNSGGISPVLDQIVDRLAHGGVPSDQMHIAFVNLREIRGIRFGTNGPLVYHDKSYDLDLGIYAYGSFSVRIVDPVLFIKSFVPPGQFHYSFNDPKVRMQMIAELLQSLSVSINSLSDRFSISQLPAQAGIIAEQIRNNRFGAGTWSERFGFELVNVAINNIEFSDESKMIIDRYNKNRIGLKVFEKIPKLVSDMFAHQKTDSLSHSEYTAEQKIELVKQLNELLDKGVLTKEEFDLKKKEIIGL